MTKANIQMQQQCSSAGEYKTLVLNLLLLANLGLNLKYVQEVGYMYHINNLNLYAILLGVLASDNSCIICSLSVDAMFTLQIVKNFQLLCYFTKSSWHQIILTSYLTPYFSLFFLLYSWFQSDDKIQDVYIYCSHFKVLQHN